MNDTLVWPVTNRRLHLAGQFTGPLLINDWRIILPVHK